MFLIFLSIKASNFRLFKILLFIQVDLSKGQLCLLPRKKLAHAPFEGANYNRVIENREERKRINFLIHFGDGPEVSIRKLSTVTLLICLFTSYILIVFICLYI